MITMYNRPTAKGLYQVKMVFNPTDPTGLRQMQGETLLPNQDGAYLSGTLYKLDAQGAPLVPSIQEVEASLARNGDLREYTFYKGVGFPVKDGKTSEVEFHMFLLQDLVVPEGLANVTQTLIHENGDILYDIDSNGVRYDYKTQALGNFAFLFGFWTIFGKLIGKMALWLGGSWLIYSTYIQGTSIDPAKLVGSTTTQPSGSKSPLDKVKDTLETGVTFVKVAVGGLAVYFAGKILLSLAESTKRGRK